MFVQHKDCVIRAKCLKDVSYDVKLNLPRGDYFSGCVDVRFTVTQLPTNDTWLDFRGLKITEYQINGEAADSSKDLFNNHHVLLPNAQLRVNQVNEVRIFFLNKYRTDGVGLHSFVDKVDSQ